MKKIPTLFVRDPEDRKRLLPEVTPGCEWVLDGDGEATRKYDGTCCLVRDGKLYKRREVKPGKSAPPGFTLVDTDGVTGKSVGWVPVTDAPDDAVHREVWDHYHEHGLALEDGTYELVGPKINGNPEGYEVHDLVPHGQEVFVGVPPSFDGLRDLLTSDDFRHEGIVWHHPDGRMVKLKRRDFA